MPALIPTAHRAEIVWLGRVANRKDGLVSEAVERLRLDFSGPEGEAHGGLTRDSCSRVLRQYPRGTEIRNTRQLSIISAEELAEIAADMGIEQLDPALLGATMVVKGLRDFTHLPPSSRLQGEAGATVVVDMENQSCQLPARPIESRHPGQGAAFRRAAKDRRGVTAWVEREGLISVGEVLTLHIPAQRAWALASDG